VTAAPTQGRPFDTILDVLPTSALDDESRTALASHLRKLDSLGRKDVRTGELYADEAVLRDLLVPTHPVEVVDGFLDRLRALPESRLVTGTKAGLDAVPMLGVIEHAALPTEALPTEAPPIRLEEGVTLDDVKAAIQRYDPRLRDELFEPATLTGALKDIVAGSVAGDAPAPLTAGDVLYCLFAKYSFWAFMALVGICMIFVLINLASAGTLTGGAIALFLFWWGATFVVFLYDLQRCMAAG
jgi:hypothetical protein